VVLSGWYKWSSDSREDVGEKAGPDGARTVWRIECVHALLVCAAAGGLALAVGRVAATSVVLGGALIWVNVWLFKQLFAFLIRRRPARRRLAIALLFAKLPLLWGAFWVVARARLVGIDGLGLAAGITCFPVAVVVVALAWRSGVEV